MLEMARGEAYDDYRANATNGFSLRYGPFERENVIDSTLFVGGRAVHRRNGNVVETEVDT